MIRRLLLCTCIVIGLGAGFAQAQFEWWPGASYDPDIPTLEQVAGHALMEEITRPADVIRYMQALAEASPIS